MKVLLFGVVIVTVATVTCYLLVYSQIKSRTLANLQLYMFERRQLENQTFADAMNRLTFFQDEFLRLYTSDMQFTDEDFWRVYFVDKDGATRMKESYFHERMDAQLGMQWGVSSFIGNNQPVDSRDFQRRLLLANLLINRYGPAWSAVGALHASFPENALTIFAPDDPWGLKARPDLPMNELGTIKATLQAENPAREPVWTGLYYDETGGKWAITLELPVDYMGRHLINPSFDVPLEAIMHRLETDHPEGAYNFIVSKDGYLIAHPGTFNSELKQKGQISLDKLGNPDISRMWHAIANSPAASSQDVAIIEDRQGDSHLLVAPLTGPDWWFVTVYPNTRISREANRTSQLVLLLGFSLFALFYLAVYVIIAKQVKAPLQRLQQAASMVAHGEYRTVLDAPQQLPLEQQNEIGQFASSFLNMCQEVMEVQSNLQQIVERRTQELEAAVSKLQALSLLDGLTGIHNRRSFDRDLAAVFEQAKRGVESFFLLLVDVDNFKDFNDRYGHTAGDDALRQVAGVLAASIRKEDRVYRYGGEELAIVFNSADAAQAQSFCARMISAVQGLGIPHAGTPHGVITVSAGLVQFDRRFDTATAMINTADASLYDAKSLGKNRLCIAQPA